MKRIIRMAIRKVVNWAYGSDIASDLIILFHMKENIDMVVRREQLHSAVFCVGVKENEPFEMSLD